MESGFYGDSVIRYFLQFLSLSKMKISGFTFMRNTAGLYYPFRESILSVLPIVDEFVVALGQGDDGDATEAMLLEMQEPKIAILKTEWDTSRFSGGTVYAQQTDLAREACSGHWLLYLQSDEVIHEQYLNTITNVCSQYLEDEHTEGFLFRYRHFWGDYRHCVVSHAWYPSEIRIIRNRPDIRSFADAQSFRAFTAFNGVNYRDLKNSRHLRVRRIPAEVYHYGWVRPPSMMKRKSVVMDGYYHNPEEVQRRHADKPEPFDYGNMCDYSLFEGTHPRVMECFMQKFDWGNTLHFEPDYKPSRPSLKHERFKYRMLTAIEQKVLRGKQLFGYRNWKVIR